MVYDGICVCAGKGLSVSSVFAEIMPRILLSFSFVICGCWSGRRGGGLKVTYVLEQEN